MAAAQKKMQYVRLGKSGLQVSKIILGCMSYGSSKWQPWVLDEEESLKHIEAAWNMGINTFDTANVYSNGESEKILGKAIKQLKIPRDEIVILTKVYFPTDSKHQEYNALAKNSHEAWKEDGYTNRFGLSRKHIFESIKASLERLQLDYVDVLQCHRWDADTPFEETMQALHDVVQAGYVRYIGMSSCWAYQFGLMQNYAIANRLTPFISVQNLYNAAYREEEREMLPLLKHYGVGCIPWSPLARGFLARSVDQQKDTTRGGSDRMIGSFSTDADLAINKAVEKLAKEKGESMAKIAMAYVISKPDITAPIIGSTKLESIRELADAVHIKLSPEEIKSIDELYKPKPIFGHK